MNEPGLEFVWVGDDAVDPLQQAQTLNILVGAGIKTREEARAELGLGAEGVGSLWVRWPWGSLIRITMSKVASHGGQCGWAYRKCGAQAAVRGCSGREQRCGDVGCGGREVAQFEDRSTGAAHR